MGWLEAQERYHQGKTLTDQSVEDLVARRVLRGLGLVQKDLPRVERAIFGEADFDAAIWPRTLKLMRYALRMEGYGRYAEDPVFECYEATGGDHKDILERLSEVPIDEILKPVFMTRIKGSTTSMTYSLWDKTVTGMGQTLIPPFTVLTEIPQTTAWLVVQETESFIRQFMLKDLFRSGLERIVNE